MGGVARRAWARNPNAVAVSADYNRAHPELGHVTLPYPVDPALIKDVLEKV